MASVSKFLQALNDPLILIHEKKISSTNATVNSVGVGLKESKAFVDCC